MKISFIATVYNEESTIIQLLKSLFFQSKLPDEIIIVDGGSTDKTVANIKNQISKIKYKTNFKKTKFKLIIKKGNRSTGRNEAIRNAKGDVILCSDAGCILDKDWIKNIAKPFEKMSTDVVAGYYKGLYKNVFEKSLIPYVLVMPDKVNGEKFLPSSRSMAFRKHVWLKAGKFPDEFSNNEDYVFARNLEQIKAKIFFKKDAIVNWIPRRNIKSTFMMFYCFAKGDSESHIFRPKVILLFFRYIIGLLLIVFYVLLKSYSILNIFYSLFFIYIFWSIVKNYKYVNDLKAIFYLPLIQFTSDIAVILGTIKGFLSFVNKNAR